MNIPTTTFLRLSKEKQRRIMDAAIDEFAKNDFDNVNISDIIKHAKIPRGSFYQYFKDKMDLFMYVFEIITARKLDYLGDTMTNASNIPFFELFEQLFQLGAKFAYENPKFVSIMNHLIKSKGKTYNTLIKNSLDLSISYYKEMIDRDKEKGLIRNDIDSTTLAELVNEMTLNMAINEIVMHGEDFNFKSMSEKINKILYIFKKGILTGNE